MEDLQEIISDSINFLKKQTLDVKFAHAISSLPFPLETMQKALQFHVASLNKPGASNEDLQQMKVIRSLYISLGNYIASKDAELVNQINEKYIALAKERNIHKVAEDERHLMSGHEYREYMGVLEKIESNRNKLREEIDPLISKETIG